MTKEQRYTATIREIEVRLQRGGDLIGDLGNVAAVIKKRLDYFWIGFYFYRENHLVLGPFQGPPACVFLSMDNGVCATCAKERKTIIVPNVDEFPGHVACDRNSKSEISVPLFNNNSEIMGVLDIDSDELDSFGDVDKKYLEKIEMMLRECWTDHY